jgi:hypothetical protein
VQSGSGRAACRKGLILSNPQEPHEPAHPDAGREPRRQTPPLPQHVPPGQPPIPAYGPGGQPPIPAYGPGGQPPTRSRKALWIVLGIVGGVLLLTVVGVVLLVNLVGGATNKARGLADDFTKLVIAGNTDQAYDGFFDPALQDKISKEDFAQGVKSLELNDSCKPAYNDLKVSSENGNDSADVSGVISCDGKEVDLAYRFSGSGDLKMTSIRLKPKA